MPYKLSSLSSDIVQPDTLLDQDNANRLFIDVRLGEPEDELKSYHECHIHGAVHAQIRDVFASPPTPQSGNLPLPRLHDLESQLKAWQVDDNTEIVLYGPSMALAARGWWVLRWAGLRNVHVLDGGLKAWIAAGGPVAQGDFLPAPRAHGAALTLRSGNLPSVSVDEVETLPESVVLIDARDESSYDAGHIARARHLPASELWTPGSHLRTVDEVQKLYARVGAAEGSDVVVYCGGGVLSALQVLTLQALGISARLFVGSWSEWNKSSRRMALSEVKGVVS